MTQAGDRQIIACTHAPEVTAEHRAAMVKLQPKQYDPVAAGIEPGDLFKVQESDE
jgi:hypothetical protein